PGGRGQGSGGSVLPCRKSPKYPQHITHCTRARCYLSHWDRESPRSHPEGQGELQVPS
ncbi:unnamed protein product, partial [Coccothraustes coccothraustes]